MSQDWATRLKSAGTAADLAKNACDEAFEQMYGTVRAARAAGRTVPQLMEISGLSKARIDRAIETPGPVPVLPCSDTDLRIAVHAAAAADAEYIAARGRRDVLMLQAGMSSGLTYRDIAKIAGTSRRYEWQLRTGQMLVDRHSHRQQVFEGAGVEAWRETERTALRGRRRAVKAGEYDLKGHGLHAYGLGCRCDVCVEAVRDLREGRIEIRHGSGGYSAGCRCDVCREARNAYDRARYHRKKRQTRRSA